GRPADVEAGRQAHVAAGREDPARVLWGEVTVVAVNVDAVRPVRGGVGAPAGDGLDIVVLPAEVLGRHHVGGEKGDVDPRHHRILLQVPEEPHRGELAVAGQVEAGLRLDG